MSEHHIPLFGAARAERPEHEPRRAHGQVRFAAAPIALWCLLLAAPVMPDGEPTTRESGWFPADSVVRAMVAARVDAGSAVGLVVGLVENGGMRIVTAGRSDGPESIGREG